MYAPNQTQYAFPYALYHTRPPDCRRVCLPMYGYNDSFNLSVATAMVLHHLFLCCPEARGDLTPERKRALRLEWCVRAATKLNIPLGRQKGRARNARLSSWGGFGAWQPGWSCRDHCSRMAY